MGVGVISQPRLHVYTAPAQVLADTRGRRSVKAMGSPGIDGGDGDPQQIGDFKCGQPLVLWSIIKRGHTGTIAIRCGHV